MNKLVLIFSALVIVAGCSKDDPISEREQLINALAGSWGNPTVIHETDGDISSQYETLLISFVKDVNESRDGFFIISNGGRAFPESGGQWKLTDNLSAIDNSSAHSWEVGFVNDKLRLVLEIPTSPGRVNGLSGRVTVVLVRK